MRNQELREGAEQHAKILLLLQTAEAGDRMSALTAKRFRQIILYRIENHSLRNLIREIRRRIVGLADQHVRMAVEPLAEPIGLFTTTHTRRIVALRDYQAVGKPGERDDGLHVHEVLERHETSAGVALRNIPEPGDAAHLGRGTGPPGAVFLLDALSDLILGIKIVVDGDADALAAAGELRSKDADDASGPAIRQGVAHEDNVSVL